MTRAESMDVVNDSTTMQSRIDSVLSAPIMEWDHSPEIRWQPGDPLYRRGQGNHIRRMISVEGIGFLDTHEWDQLRRRPIWEVVYTHDDTIDGYKFLVDCDDCQVGIGNDERHCWVCGKMLMTMTKNEKKSIEAAEHKRRRQLEWNDFLRRGSGSDVEEIDYRGHIISFHNIRWMADWLREHPDRYHVQIARTVPVAEMFRAYDDGPGPDSIQRNTVMFQRREVFEMEELMFDVIRERHIEQMWERANTPMRVRGVRSVGLVLDEMAEVPQEVLEDVVTYAQADAAATMQMFHNFSTRDEHEAIMHSLQVLRDLIQNPPNFTVVEPPPPRGVPIFWQTPMSEWATTHILNFEEEDASPEADLDIPRLSARAIRPDLYRPGYEQFFNQGESNVFTRALHHSPQAGGNRRR